MTVEEDVYDLWLVEVHTDKQSGKFALIQGGLTKKVLKTVGMLYNNNNNTPATTITLGKYADGPPLDEPW